MNDNENILQEKDLLNDERISRFLQGKMKADEEATFMEEMKNNDDLRASKTCKGYETSG